MNANLPLKITPYSHQRAAYEFALKRDSTALLMEMGTGKTLTAIAVAGRLYLDGKIRRALIVAPLSVLGVWRDEFERYADFGCTLAVLEQASTVKKADSLRHLQGEPLQVAVVNYESARLIADEIVRWKPDLVICDEAHRLKTHNSQQSKALHKIGAIARYRLILTGTLITNHAEDVFSPYKFLDPKIFGSSYYSWRSYYFDAYGYGNHQFRLKPSKESEFLSKMHSVAFRVTKAECLDLPATSNVTRYVELEQSAAKIYREISRECYAELANSEVSAANVLTKLLRLSQLTGGFVTDDGGGVNRVSTAKLDALADIVNEAVNEGRKIVVIARFTPEVEAICKMLAKRGVGYARVDGSVKNRAAEVEKFQNNAEIMAFVGQIQVAGVGLTLTASSLTPATLVHHKRKLTDGGTNDGDNLQSLCQSCHSRLHSEQGDRWQT